MTSIYTLPYYYLTVLGIRERVLNRPETLRKHPGLVWTLSEKTVSFTVLALSKSVSHCMIYAAGWLGTDCWFRA